MSEPIDERTRAILEASAARQGADEERSYNKPNGLCYQCGAPLNASMVGGYKLHDGRWSVAAAANMTKEQIEAAIDISEDNIAKLKDRLARGRYRGAA